MPSMTVAPVVVSPETDSNTASVTDMSGLLASRSGTLPQSPSATQNMTTTMNPSRRRSSLAVTPHR